MTKKSNTKEFKEKVRSLVAKEYEVLGEYINSRIKIKMLHKKCGYEYEVAPDAFLRGNRCPKCSGKLQKTTIQFKQEVFNLVGDEYIVLSDYINSKIKIKVRHKECGYEYKVAPNSFLRGRRCPKCSGKMKKTNEQFKQEVFDFAGDEYIVLDEYINNSTKIRILHNTCGFKYETTPNHFLSGRRCPKCGGTLKKNTEIFKKEVINLVGKEYTVLGEYIDSATKIKIKHNKCKHEYEVTPAGFLRGNRCPKCSGKMKKTTEIFKKELFDLVGDEYTILGKYAGNKIKIKIKHNKCGFEYNVKPNVFLTGSRCPKCNQAKGEEMIHRFLNKMGFKIKMQFKLEDCKNIQPLPFNFAIFNGDKLKTLIEYDGQQHFQPIKHFGGLETLKERKKNDEIKNKYCEENQIPLIRISYKDFDNIESILEKKLKLRHQDVIKRSKEFKLKHVSSYTEDFIKKVENLTWDEYTVLGEYVYSNKKIKIRHNKCGYEYKVTHPVLCRVEDAQNVQEL